MKEGAQDILRAKLEARRQEGSFRILPTARKLSDFSSNDYLGFARSQKLKSILDAELERCGFWPIGATGSRLISGNSNYVEALEDQVADYHNAQAALIFNSGYAANTGLLGAIGDRGTTILYDELSHASIRDGIRVGFARGLGFKHNDLSDLGKKLKAVKNRAYVVVEALYSMDGDIAPLAGLVELCESFNASLICRK